MAFTRLLYSTNSPKSMLEQAADALERKDYKTAAKIIATLVAQRPDDHQVQLYAAQLQEATNKLDNALEIYRLLLQHSVNLKITNDARAGILRIEEVQARIQANAYACARAGIEDNVEPGFLILEPIEVEDKKHAAQKFAAIMEIDNYSARLQLPSRGWRLYRVGKMGELEFYRDLLLQAEIPCFCVSLQQTQQLFVFNVSHFQSFEPQASIVCMDDRSELHTFNFHWSEVTQMIMGMLPIFEEVVEIDNRNRTYRKPKILDYIHVCDLQLRKRRSIFRLCSQTYDFCDFKQLITQSRRQFTGAFTNESTGDLSFLTGQRLQLTSRNNWQNLMAQIHDRVSGVPICNDFTPFAETAFGFPELLTHIHPHLELLRRSDSVWDRAFQLYSTLSMSKK
ncbi:MAG: tetratricopeptide repeat protein [Chamaesiphon sp. CSU_1_12]|nr:tetratricopeptide repeat protein [Chamaesiphon sp. CSU_1_12]